MGFQLQSKRAIVMDGAMGTELIAQGLDVRADIAERWVLTRPELIADIHRGYAIAGAELLQTCTFGALRGRLEPKGLGAEVTAICSAAVKLARAPGLPVVASLGPTGLCTTVDRGHEPTVRAEITKQVAEAARALADAGADALHLETQYHPAELLAAAEGARLGAPDLPLWISITVMTGDAGLCTPHGFSIDRMLAALKEASPDAVGVNCSQDAERIRDAVIRLVDAGLGPVLARPQARSSEKCATGRSKETPARFAEHAVRLYDLGAIAVGGCCGTYPGSITALAQALRPAPVHVAR